MLVRVSLGLNEADCRRTETHYFVMEARCFESADEIWGHIGGRLCANRARVAVGDFESAARSLCSEIESSVCELLDSPSVVSPASSHVKLLQVRREIFFQESRSKAKAEEPGVPPMAEGFSRTTEVEENGNKVCVICLENMKAEVTRTVLPCCHEYHYDCILPWLGRCPSCPVCRAKIRLSGWTGSIFCVFPRADDLSPI